MLNERLISNIKRVDLEPIERPSPRFGPGAEPSFPGYPRFLVTAVPINSVLQPDALRQFYRGGVPQQRIFPRLT